MDSAENESRSAEAKSENLPTPLNRAPLVVPQYLLTCQVFLRLLACVYLAAFISFWVQIDGLIGSSGISPVTRYLEIQRRVDPHWLISNPTLCWLSSSDAFLHALCVAGVVFSLMVVAGLAQLPALLLLWVTYLSLAVAGQDFFMFQWDSMLLETGLLAALFAPLQLGPKLSRQAPPPRISLWLFRWLLFRLMFLSGLVKLTSGDPAWRDGTAMNYHYLTQPLPTWTSWYAWHLPPTFQLISVVVMFVIELIVPLMVFGPRRLRLIAFWPLAGLQVLIALTGNYGFFNLLSVVLCITLLDDDALRWTMRRWRKPLPNPPAQAPHAPLAWPIWITAPVGAILFLLTLWAAVREPGFGPASAIWPDYVMSYAGRFRSTNGYGLFRVMTRARREIIIVGSNDGQTWLAYEFKYKPGDPSRRPPFIFQHMPRLDWQMWFAALGQESPWMTGLVYHLLQGTPQVTALLARNPFPDSPPRYIRGRLYDYRFSTPAQKKSQGVWWQRQFAAEYFPAVTTVRE
jgi:hypothetical protein